MNDTLPDQDAHEKTIDLRIDRLREAIARADRSYRAGDTRDAGRTISVLIENRALVAAHTSTVIDHMVRTVPDAAQQDLLIVFRVRKHTLLLEAANIAIARMRTLIGDTQ